MSTNTDVTAVILAGGMARRMQGQDKGLVRFAGVPMIARIIDQMKHQCAHVVINANRNIAQYEQFRLPVFSDDMPDYQGPLSGMYTALGKIDTAWMITLPCDGPFVSDRYVSRMTRSVADTRRKLAVASCHDRLQPVYALIHQDLKSSLGTFLTTGERKIDRWYGQHDFATVNLDDMPETFLNINTPEELRRLENEYPTG